MKNILAISAFLVAITTTLSAQTINSADLQVTGLTCSMCSQATQKSLETISSINNITPDLNKGVFVLKFKDDAPIDFDLIQEKVDKAGFSVGALTADMNFNDIKVDDNGQAIVGNYVYRFANLKNKTLNGPLKVTFIDENFGSKSTFKKNVAKYALKGDGLGTVDGKSVRIYHLIAS